VGGIRRVGSARRLMCGSVACPCVPAQVIALNLTFAHEAARGVRYERLYLTRPDIALWAEIDLRRYCAHAVDCHGSHTSARSLHCIRSLFSLCGVCTVYAAQVYYSNCHPPYFPNRPDGCPSDFHYVMTSASAHTLAASMLTQLHEYRNVRNDMSNSAMGRFTHDVLRVRPHPHRSHRHSAALHHSHDRSRPARPREHAHTLLPSTPTGYRCPSRQTTS
jgi:hypothetical protein